jgi:cytochrome P450
MFAGHETTAKSVSFPNASTGNAYQLTLQLTFGLWELAKNRRVQKKLREEVTATLGKIKARGKIDFAVEDFESMPYLVAVVKVCLEQSDYLLARVNH